MFDNAAVSATGAEQSPGVSYLNLSGANEARTDELVTTAFPLSRCMSAKMLSCPDLQAYRIRLDGNMEASLLNK